jgi:hypothetical protein
MNLRTMKIVTTRPPNFDKIAAAFKGATRPGVIFCYGDSIHNPGGGPLTHALLAHESVHAHRQNGDPETWWDRYIAEPAFRYEEELAAHRQEYAVACEGLTRNQRRIELRLIARRLSGPLYGCEVSSDAAAQAIRSAA